MSFGTFSFTEIIFSPARCPGRFLRRRGAVVAGENNSADEWQHVFFRISCRKPLPIKQVQKCAANGAVIDDAPLKNARALADFSVTTKENQWQCALKSTPSLVLSIVLLNQICTTSLLKTTEAGQ
jgi:hypothetical protein